MKYFPMGNFPTHLLADQTHGKGVASPVQGSDGSPGISCHRIEFHRVPHIIASSFSSTRKDPLLSFKSENLATEKVKSPLPQKWKPGN